MTNYNELRDGQEFYGNGYKKGYEDAKQEFERAKGKWIECTKSGVDLIIQNVRSINNIE